MRSVVSGADVACAVAGEGADRPHPGEGGHVHALPEAVQHDAARVHEPDVDARAVRREVRAVELAERVGGGDDGPDGVPVAAVPGAEAGGDGQGGAGAPEDGLQARQEARGRRGAPLQGRHRQ
eukprot:3404969-Rhodomonas_salina.1